MSLGLSLDKSCLEDPQHLPQGGLCSLHASSDTWLCWLLWSPSVGGFSYSPWSDGEQAGGVPGGLPCSWNQTSAVAVGAGNQRHLLWTTPKAVVMEESW